MWGAIEDTSVETENMKLRSSLMMALASYLERSSLTQSQAAELFSVTQPCISDLKRGKINLFGLDALVNIAAAAGMHIEMRIHQPA